METDFNSSQYLFGGEPAPDPYPGPCIGVDGCRGGWLAAVLENGEPRFELYARFAELWRAHRNAPFLLVDMPIGLPHAAAPVRACDAEARRLLGPRRASVFSPPCREALAAGNHASASAANRAVTGRGLSIQAWNIAPRIRELDELLRAEPDAAQRILECHPELCFAALLGAPARFAKRAPEGRSERLRVLTRLCPDAKARIVQGMENRSRAVAADDCADALVLALALRAALEPGRGQAYPAGVVRLGCPPGEARPRVDAEGLPMTIHVPRAAAPGAEA